MFAALPPIQQPFALPGSNIPSPHYVSNPPPSHPYSPQRPSPLSPRRHRQSPPEMMTDNTNPPNSSTNNSNSFNFFAPQTTANNTTNPFAPPPPSNTAPSQSSRSRSSPTYAQRYTSTVSNPLNNIIPRSHTTSATQSARNARRSAFLNRVKRDRDDGRFENRGEQIVLMEHAAEEKKWGEAMRRRAERLFGEGVQEEEVDFGVEDEDEANALDEYILQQEEEAMQMQMQMQMQAQHQEQMQMQIQNQQHTQHGNYQHTPNNTTSSFSDDEYDDIFTDLADYSQDMDMSG
ncbi:hypothetical protein P168DRAFT_300871 [Aspergillus campestris IBT 28561]|uniref:Uncharacterized protein n=1 Tax=Aspergillus campestris (strain IBT 28561) TaxID=1392248 RepID=A0A2I1DE38_ASPC2|nr:uncharacterized protein P168DRAFT_300871 [Aspergillus campestris IBT 28561]PKY08110.1 hypothetical protein P168DRAFT_300871 [Aspergillus campestris IBT 28561]